MLGEDGVPRIVEKALVLPPQSKMGLIGDAELESHNKAELLYSKYAESFDRDSAYEFLQRLNQKAEMAAREAALQAQKEKEENAAELAAQKEAEREAAKKAKEAEAKKKQADKAMKNTAMSAAGTVGREVGKTVGGTIGGKFGKTLGGNVGASFFRGVLGTIFK